MFPGDIFEFPFARRFFTTPEGRRMHYVDEGHGPPVLMVHGNPSWSYLYRKLIIGLKPDFRCLAPDHVGLGLSDRPTEADYGFRLEDRVRDLTAFITSLNLAHPLHLVVHDWGGPIGLGWAAEHPAQVASVTLMNTGLARPAGYRLPWRLALFKHLGRPGFRLARDTRAFTWGTARLGVVKPLPARVEAAFLAPYAGPAERLAVARFVADIPLRPNHPSAARLDEINRRGTALLNEKPAALVWGLRDFVFDRRFFLNWRARLPRAESLVLPEAGHYLLEDEPERAVAFIGEFIRRQAALGVYL